MCKFNESSFEDCQLILSLFQMKTFTHGFHLMKCYLLFLVFVIYEFFKLEKKAKYVASPATSGPRICVQNYDENSDDDSFRTSLNVSRVSKTSQVDDDNNNDSSVTPTLNNSIPRVTIFNSTPLNHFNHQNGVSSRKGFRRDLTKLR